MKLSTLFVTGSLTYSGIAMASLPEMEAVPQMEVHSSLSELS